MAKSTFDNTRSPVGGQVRGGLDRYNAPAASKSSNLPAALTDEKANAGERAADKVDCEQNPDEAVCEIAKEENRRGSSER